MNRRRAFSLMETLVAAAVFGLAVTGLLMAVNNLYRGLAASAQDSADTLDREGVRHAALARPSVAALLAGGTMTTPDGRALTWRAALAPTEATGLHRLTLEYASGARSGVSRLLVFKPEWSDPKIAAARLAALRAGDDRDGEAPAR